MLHTVGVNVPMRLEYRCSRNVFMCCAVNISSTVFVNSTGSPLKFLKDISKSSTRPILFCPLGKKIDKAVDKHSSIVTALSTLRCRVPPPLVVRTCLWSLVRRSWFHQPSSNFLDDLLACLLPWRWGPLTTAPEKYNMHVFAS